MALAQVQQRMQEVADTYSRLVFGFALDRTGNRHESEELAQEILVELMQSIAKGTHIRQMDAYVWTICRYTWANWVDRRSKDRHLYQQNDLPLSLPGSDGDLSERLIGEEMLSLLRREIAFLSERQRRIVVMHYVQGLRQQAIAQQLGIPVGTVKWHLHRAKDELRKGMERVRTQGALSYAPIRLTSLGHSGMPGKLGDTAHFLRRSLTQNIVWAAYQRPMTINELAEELGTVPPYIEDEVRYLVEYDFMIEVRPGAYQSNFIIWNDTAEQLGEIHNLFAEAAGKLAELHFDALYGQRHAIDQTGLYYPDRDFNFLMWTLLPMNIQEQALSAWRERYGEPFAMDKLRPRADGGKYIAFASLSQHVDLPYDARLYQLSGPMTRSDGKKLYLWQLDSYWSDRPGWQDLYLNDIQLCFAYWNGELTDEERYAEEYAFLLKKGYLRRTDSGFQFNVVWVKGPKTVDALRAVIGGPGSKVDLRDEYGAVLGDLYTSLVGIRMRNKPNHIRDQVEHMAMWETGTSLIVYMLKNLIDAGKLLPPKPHQKKTVTTWMQVLQ